MPTRREKAEGSRSARHDYYGNKTFSELFPFVIYDSIFDFSNISTVDSVPSVHRSILCSEREQNVFDFSSVECKPLAHPSVVCPFNLSRWERLSLDMPDQDLRNYVLRGLRVV